jgi:hypothetical protein
MSGGEIYLPLFFVPRGADRSSAWRRFLRDFHFFPFPLRSRNQFFLAQPCSASHVLKSAGGHFLTMAGTTIARGCEAMRRLLHRHSLPAPFPEGELRARSEGTRNSSGNHGHREKTEREGLEPSVGGEPYTGLAIAVGPSSNVLSSQKTLERSTFSLGNHTARVVHGRLRWTLSGHLQHGRECSPRFPATSLLGVPSNAPEPLRVRAEKLGMRLLYLLAIPFLDEAQGRLLTDKESFPLPGARERSCRASHPNDFHIPCSVLVLVVPAHPCLRVLFLISFVPALRRQVDVVVRTVHHVHAPRVT